MTNRGGKPAFSALRAAAYHRSDVASHKGLGSSGKFGFLIAR
jgi:hypothetical protein